MEETNSVSFYFHNLSKKNLAWVQNDSFFFQDDIDYKFLKLFLRLHLTENVCAFKKALENLVIRRIFPSVGINMLDKSFRLTKI
jgi:hypothetical protein